MRLDQFIFGLGLGSLLFACSSSQVTSTIIVRPELVAVAPDDFLGTLHCGGGPGEVQSYVATLFDVTPPADGGPTPSPGFQLASSPATSCRFPVTFSYVSVDHYYRAEIDGYDRAPTLGANDLDPTHIHPLVDGERVQVENTSGAPVLVLARWLAHCGGYPPTDLDAGTDSDAAAADASTGVVSFDALTQTVHDCAGGFYVAPPPAAQ